MAEYPYHMTDGYRVGLIKHAIECLERNEVANALDVLRRAADEAHVLAAVQQILADLEKREAAPCP